MLVMVISFLIIADLELYTAWGYRMDATPLQYFKSPKEMVATVSASPCFYPVVPVLFYWRFLFLFIKDILIRFIDRKQKRFHVADVFLSISDSISFVPIRGGIQKIPMNISDVYFSEKIFADHAAINLPWNIVFSILNRHMMPKPI